MVPAISTIQIKQIRQKVELRMIGHTNKQKNRQTEIYIYVYIGPYFITKSSGFDGAVVSVFDS